MAVLELRHPELKKSDEGSEVRTFLRTRENAGQLCCEPATQVKDLIQFGLLSVNNQHS
jgi:hypothetical protein